VPLNVAVLPEPAANPPTVVKPEPLELLVTAKVPLLTEIPAEVLTALSNLTVPVLPLDPMVKELLLVVHVPVLKSVIPPGAAVRVTP
jgi:hypothetical protein